MECEAAFLQIEASVGVAGVFSAARCPDADYGSASGPQVHSDPQLDGLNVENCRRLMDLNILQYVVCVHILQCLSSVGHHTHHLRQISMFISGPPLHLSDEFLLKKPPPPRLTFKS